MYYTVIKNDYWKFHSLTKAKAKCDAQEGPSWVFDEVYCNVSRWLKGLSIDDNAKPTFENTAAALWTKYSDEADKLEKERKKNDSKTSN